MTFKDIVYKNMKYKFSQYISYYLCISFSITVFFMYTTIIYNQSLMKEVAGTPIEDMAGSILWMIGIFSFFLISYTYIHFVHSKYKEIGLFLTLGLSYKEIKRLFVIENSILVLFSVLTGMITGSIFSKFFYDLNIYLLGINPIEFELNLKSYWITLVVFLSIFIFLIGLSLRHISRVEITQLLKQNRLAKFNHKPYPFLGLLGVIGYFSSFFLVDITLKETYFQYNTYLILTFIVMGILSLYLMIAYLGDFFLRLVQKKKKLYRRHILLWSSLRHRFNAYKKMFFAITLLSSFVIFLTGALFGVHQTLFETIKTEYPYDVMFIESNQYKGLTDDQFKETAKNHDLKITDEKQLSFLNLRLQKEWNGETILWGDVVVVSDEVFSSFTNRSIDVLPNQAISLVAFKQVYPWYKDQEDIQLFEPNSDQIHRYQFQEEVYGNYLNVNNYTYHNLIVLDHFDYEELKGQVNQNYQETFHLYQFENWRKTKPLILDLVKWLKEHNHYQQENDYELFRYWNLIPSSKVMAYEMDKQNSSFNLFTFSFIGLLFLISSGIVLAFKVFNDFTDYKQSYDQLNKVGVTDKEMSQWIKSELKLIFFFPLLIGSITGFLLIVITMVNVLYYHQILLNSFYIILMYGLLQTIFYLFIKNKVINHLLK